MVISASGSASGGVKEIENVALHDAQADHAGTSSEKPLIDQKAAADIEKTSLQIQVSALFLLKVFHQSNSSTIKEDSSTEILAVLLSISSLTMVSLEAKACHKVNSPQLPLRSKDIHPPTHPHNSSLLLENKDVPLTLQSTLETSPILSRHEFEELTSVIDHCQYQAIPEHVFQRINNILQNDLNTQVLQRSTQRLITHFVRHYATVSTEGVSHGLLNQQQAIIGSQLKELLKSALPLMGKSWTFETMAATLGLLKHLKFLTRQDPEMANEIGEKILDALPKLNNPAFQAQIIPALMQGYQYLSIPLQKRVYELALNGLAAAQPGAATSDTAASRNADTLLVLGLLLHAPSVDVINPVEREKIIDVALERVKDDLDTSDAAVLSTLDTLVPGMTDSQARDFAAIRPAVLADSTSYAQFKVLERELKTPAVFS